MTKQSYFWATPSGPINLIEGDKYPDGSDYAENFTDRSGEGRYDHAGYEAAIQAAKESSVPIQDQEKAAHMIHQRYELKRGEVYGPFTVGYEIQELHYCKLCGAYKSIKRIPCQNAYCGKTTERVAILYDDTPEEDIDTQFAESAKAHIRNAPAKTYRAVPEKEPQEDQEAFLLHLIDVTACFVMEQNMFMATSTRKELIQKARETFTTNGPR